MKGGSLFGTVFFWGRYFSLLLRVAKTVPVPVLQNYNFNQELYEIAHVELVVLQLQLQLILGAIITTLLQPWPRTQKNEDTESTSWTIMNLACIHK